MRMIAEDEKEESLLIAHRRLEALVKACGNIELIEAWNEFSMLCDVVIEIED